MPEFARRFGPGQDGPTQDWLRSIQGGPTQCWVEQAPKGGIHHFDRRSEEGPDASEWSFRMDRAACQVGHHGQDLAFPSTSGAPEQLKPEGSFQQLRPRNSPALPPRPRSRASFGLSDNLHRGRSCCWSRWVLFDTGPSPPPPDATWRWAQRPHDSERHECQARESTAPAGR